MSEILLKSRGITKSYPQGVSELKILRGVDIDVKAGESVAIIGSSGAGKSTLLHILGTLDRPNEGSLEILGRDVLSLNDEELSAYRNEKMGFVFQFHHLLTEFTALENVMMPLRIAGAEREAAEVEAAKSLDLLGLYDRKDHYPNQLSGGELQRVAIARALIRSPKILFADEPTGNLDSKNSLIIQELFFDLKKKLDLTLIVVTHDQQFAKRFPRTMKLSDGQWID